MHALLLGPIARRGAELLRRHFAGELSLAAIDEDAPPAALAEAFAKADILIAVRYGADLPPAPRLKLIHLPASGLDEIDFDAVPVGCQVCNAFEHAIGISEYVLAAMLQFTVDLPGRHARFRAGDWSDTPRLDGAFRPELAGRTVGCIGYGTIGQAIARRAKAFGMRVMAITRRPRQVEPEPDWIGGYGLTEALTEAADFVVVCCPLTPTTRGLLGPRYLGAMKRGAYLINVARGPIVDEDVLYDALRHGRIAGAAIDTWYHYPSAEERSVAPSHHPFATLPNVIMTPHCSGWTDGLLERRFAVIADNIERLQAGGRLRHRVHPAG
jgi:phosphoglycerate dehydrogenase-like enzyme